MGNGHNYSSLMLLNFFIVIIYFKFPLRFRQTKYLSQIGGLTVEDTTRQILSAVMTTDISRSNSFYDRGNKSAFVDLKLKSVIFGELR